MHGKNKKETKNITKIFQINCCLLLQCAIIRYIINVQLLTKCFDYGKIFELVLKDYDKLLKKLLILITKITFNFKRTKVILFRVTLMWYLSTDAEGLLLFSSIHQIRAYFIEAGVYVPIASNLSHVTAVAYDGIHVYWTNIFNGQEAIMRSEDDSTNVEVLVTAGI